MNKLTKYLQGGDLRSIAKVAQVIKLVNSQFEFDQLFSHLYATDRLIVMRAADAIEKIASANPQYLVDHKNELFKFLLMAEDKEFKWHLALLISYLTLTKHELNQAWKKLSEWVKDKNESKIVRVNSLQALYDLSKRYKEHESKFALIVHSLKSENIPSLNARIKKLLNQ